MPARCWPRRAVPVLPGDTEDTLHERIKTVERTLYPDTIRRFIDGLAQRWGMGQDHHRRLRHESTAVRLRQDRDRRPGPGARRPRVGAGVERGHLGRPGRGRHRPHRGGRPDRCPGDARWPGQDPPPDHPRRDPGRPVQARAPGGHRAPGHRSHRPGGVQPLPVRLGSLRRAHRRRGPDHGPGGGQEPRPRGHRRRARRIRRRAGRAEGRAARCPTTPGSGWPATPSPTPPATTPPSWPGSTSRSRRRSTSSTPTSFESAALLPPPSTSPWSGPARCATGRTPTSTGPGTGSSASTRGGTTSSSTAARSSRTSTSSTPTPPGGWSTSCPSGGRRTRPWPSSSTPIPAAPPSHPTWSWPTSGRWNATPSRRSGASSPSAVR